MIKIDIDDREVRAAIDRLQRKVSDLSPAMRDIAQALESETERRFEQEGPGWPRLSKKTIAQREKTGHWPGRMLQRTGALAREIASGHDATSAWVGAGGAASRKYAAIHQFGGKAGRGGKVTIPARPYLPIDDGALTDSARETILEIMRAHLADY